MCAELCSAVSEAGFSEETEGIEGVVWEGVQLGGDGRLMACGRSRRARWRKGRGSQECLGCGCLHRWRGGAGDHARGDVWDVDGTEDGVEGLLHFFRGDRVRSLCFL